MTRILVTLTHEELSRVAHAGLDRRLDAMAKGRQGRRHETIPDWKQAWFQTTVIGAFGEYAVCKAFDRLWNPTIGRIDASDVGSWEVRTTERPQPKLRVRAGDDNTKNYILCSYKGNQVLIQGWLPGARVVELGREEYDGVWTATLDELYSVVDLPGEIELGEHVRIYEDRRVR